MAQDDRDADVNFGQVLYGADYNPEQWPEDVWDEDVRLMRAAHVTTVSVPVFGWAALQPDEETFTFDWLDRVLDKLAAQGVRANLATATASVPAWVTRRYPDVLVVDEDGIRRRHGNRHTFCPSSPNFRRLSTALVRKIATRYADHPALQLWHIGNEYGTLCYCDLCADAFRQWLRERHGSLDQLNRNWNTAFWGHTFTDWAQVEPPVSKGERAIQALRIDWHRFASDALLNCLRAEVAVIREVTPHVPVTTNLMGAFFPLEYHRWARELDVVSWDNYPRPNDPPETVAFNHALMRGLREGQPFLLMEQSPSQQNWQPYNWIKPPGLLRLQSYQAVAQGADSVMYFQWRRFPRRHREAARCGGGAPRPLRRAGLPRGGRARPRAGGPRHPHDGGRVAARAAVLFDWPTWWSLRFSSGPSVDLDYLEQCRSAYTPRHQLGVQTDVLAPDADLSAYDLIVAPVLTMVEEPVATAIADRVREGATFVATAFTGLVDQHDLVHPGGAPGPLRDVLGLTVEETDALPPDRTNAVRLGADVGTLPAGTELPAGILCERLFLEGAKPVGEYTRDFYAGEPALTRNSYGQGQAYYLPTLLTGDGQRRLLTALCTEVGIGSPLAGGAPPPAGMEVTRRVGPSGAGVLYLLNHGADAARVRLRPGVHTDLLTGRTYDAEVSVPLRGVLILAEPTS